MLNYWSDINLIFIRPINKLEIVPSVEGGSTEDACKAETVTEVLQRRGELSEKGGHLKQSIWCSELENFMVLKFSMKYIFIQRHQENNEQEENWYNDVLLIKLFLFNLTRQQVVTDILHIYSFLHQVCFM